MKGPFDRLKDLWQRARTPDEAKNFREKQEKEEAFETIDRGLRQVPLAKIVGSVGRYHDFDRSFKPKQPMVSHRMAEIRRAMASGKTMPPVRLYQIKDEYYVVDGNHRVSAAKELNRDVIEAQVLEFLPSKKTKDNILYYEQSDFGEKTGLEAPINLSEIGVYARLLSQINRHKEFLERETESEVSFKEAARDWYRTIFTPLRRIIEKGRLPEHFRDRTLDDFYAYISVHQWERPDVTMSYGMGINRLVSRNMEEFRRMVSKLDENDYPEMVREITAFVLMNVSAKREYRIVEKLFELDEVREVHSVHGSVDVLIKVILRRDLLSSDAETIGEFVHFKIRQIPGILSTQTLIPSKSQMKDDPAT